VPRLIELACPRLAVLVRLAQFLLVLAVSSMTMSMLAALETVDRSGDIVREHAKAWKVGVRNYGRRYIDDRIVVQANFLRFRHGCKVSEDCFEQVVVVLVPG
jgi:hypothetical protein